MPKPSQVLIILPICKTKVGTGRKRQMILPILACLLACFVQPLAKVVMTGLWPNKRMAEGLYCLEVF